ncbi:MAG: nuclear transport factor 2 family protein [Cyanobacteria bacterium P01_A01_bin.135]
MDKLSESQIAELEARLRRAMLTSDVSELDALIAAELIFTSHLGQVVSKEEDLAMHRSGVLELTDLTLSEQRIRIYEGFAVVSVQAHLRGRYDGQALDEHIRYTRVWGKSSAGPLQIVAGHGSVIIR